MTNNSSIQVCLLVTIYIVSHHEPNILFSFLTNVINPDFYNWNRVKVRYCDGASFTGDVEAVDPVSFAKFKGV